MTHPNHHDRHTISDSPTPPPDRRPSLSLSTTPCQPTLSLGLVLLAMVLLAANMRAPIVALGSIAPIIQDVLAISEGQIGWLGALPMLMFALGALVSPRIGKRFGIINLLLVSIVLLSAGMLIRVLKADWWWFFAGTAVLSLAIGIANTLVAPAIKRLTPDRIPLVTGVLSITMTVMAGLAASVVLPMHELLGWQWALGSWTMLTLLALLVWLPLKAQVAHLPSSPRHTPVSTDLPPITANATATALTRPDHRDQHNDPYHTHLSPTADDIWMWRRASAWQIAAFMGIQSLLFYTVASFLPSIWIDKGLSATTAGNMGGLYQMMAPIATMILMVLMNHGRFIRPMAMFAALINVLGVAGMAYLSPQLAWFWTACIGLGGAMIFTMCIMLIGMRTYSSDQASDLSGMAQTVGYLIAFFGPSGAGWLHQRMGSWDLTLDILLLLMVVNVMFAWLASRPQMIDGQAV